jgi:hypothetical protein
MFYRRDQLRGQFRLVQECGGSDSLRQAPHSLKTPLPEARGAYFGAIMAQCRQAVGALYPPRQTLKSHFPVSGLHGTWPQI